MQYPLKPFLSIEEQVKKLIARGMSVPNIKYAETQLSRINYYRFSGYAFQFLDEDDKYRPCSFDEILGLYRFEQNLRATLFFILEDIEIFARTQIAYNFSKKHGADGHYDVSNFRNTYYHNGYIKSLEAQQKKNKSSPFVAHHDKKYGGRMPLWCAVEIMSFSTLSKLFSNMLDVDRAYISEAMGVKGNYMVNWLHCFAVLRNTCAHYGRIYNNKLSPSVILGSKTLRRYPMIQNDLIFAYMVAMLRFCPNPEKNREFVSRIIATIESQEGIIDLGLLGFPDEWEALLQDNALLTL